MWQITCATGPGDNMDRKSLIRKFDKQAKNYDARRDKDKTYKFRKRIFPEAEGSVLEVAVGSGYNFPFYSGVTEVTGVDFSGEMLKAAEAASRNHPFKTTLVQKDVEAAEFDENSFDTIVSSLSFCAYQNPVEILNKFHKWCKPDGKILLMEHGLSSNKLLAGMQRLVDPAAVMIAGCHQNRDIAGIAETSGLNIIKEERYLAGSVYLIWAETDSV